MGLPQQILYKSCRLSKHHLYVHLRAKPSKMMLRCKLPTMPATYSVGSGDPALLLTLLHHLLYAIPCAIVADPGYCF